MQSVRKEQEKSPLRCGCRIEDTICRLISVARSGHTIQGTRLEALEEASVAASKIASMSSR